MPWRSHSGKALHMALNTQSGCLAEVQGIPATQRRAGPTERRCLSRRSASSAAPPC